MNEDQKPTSTEDSNFNIGDVEQLTELEELSIRFDQDTAARHVFGSQKYGPVKFLEIDSIEMAIEEVLDLANYARYTYIKLRMVQKYLVDKIDEVPTKLGTDGFISDKG